MELSILNTKICIYKIITNNKLINNLLYPGPAQGVSGIAHTFSEAAFNIFYYRFDVV